MLETQIKATPEQVENGWKNLTEIQRQIVKVAKRLKCNVLLNIQSEGPENKLMSMEVAS